MLRKAQFSGSFYDSSPIRLKADFEHWFNDAKLPEIKGKVNGVICPHAGYMYSGFCAAHSYKLLSDSDFETAVLIHPSHRGNHFAFSVSQFDEYQTPLGNLKQNKELAEELFEQGGEIIDDWYHQYEHSMEVQLPFLYYIKPQCKVVPIMIGNQNQAVSKKLADLLNNLTDEKTVIIVSTDLSHYHSAKIAEQKDRKLIDDILSLNTNEFNNDIRSGKTEACGFAGVLSLMYYTLNSNSQMKEIHYTHSGKTSGDYEQVVGYLSAALVKG